MRTLILIFVIILSGCNINDKIDTYKERKLHELTGASINTGLELKCVRIESKYLCNRNEKCTKILVRCENEEITCYSSVYSSESMQCKFKETKPAN